jgi:peptidoglycan/xylan/chitin deacetylase (PgdA/CDA1 family)
MISGDIWTVDRVIALAVVIVSVILGFFRAYPMKSRLDRLRSFGSVVSARSQRSISFASESFAKQDDNEEWLMGTLVGDMRVEWTWHKREDVWNSGTTDAHVLWNSQGVMEFACSINSPSDVAAILKAHEVARGTRGGIPSSVTQTIIDRDAVNKQVAEGSLPSVPPYSPPAAQWALIKIMKRIFHRPSVSFFAAAPLRMTSNYHFDTDQNVVALTLDDAPCRFSTLVNSRMTEVLDLLKRYNNAKATFMVVHSFAAQPVHENDLLRALKEGHELANHGIRDESFKNTSTDDFCQAVDQCNNLLLELQQKAGFDNNSNNDNNTIKWFRAPHAYYTQEMEDVLQQKGMRNVMCDAYASCPIVQDSDAIAESLLRQAQPGSIILIHMPERGFRDWTLPALEKVLKGLQERNTKVVTLSQLEAISLAWQRQIQQN